MGDVRRFALPLRLVLEEAEATARAMPRWSVRAVDVADGRIEAVVRRGWWRGLREVVVRVRADGEGVEVAVPDGADGDRYGAALDEAVLCRVERREPGC